MIFLLEQNMEENLGKKDLTFLRFEENPGTSRTYQINCRRSKGLELDSVLMSFFQNWIVC